MKLAPHSTHVRDLSSMDDLPFLGLGRSLIIHALGKSSGITQGLNCKLLTSYTNYSIEFEICQMRGKCDIPDQHVQSHFLSLLSFMDVA